MSSSDWFCLLELHTHQAVYKAVQAAAACDVALFGHWHIDASDLSFADSDSTHVDITITGNSITNAESTVAFSLIIDFDPACL